MLLIYRILTQEYVYVSVIKSVRLIQYPIFKRHRDSFIINFERDSTINFRFTTQTFITSEHTNEHQDTNLNFFNFYSEVWLMD